MVESQASKLGTNPGALYYPLPGTATERPPERESAGSYLPSRLNNVGVIAAGATSRKSSACTAPVFASLEESVLGKKRGVATDEGQEKRTRSTSTVVA